MSKAERTTPQEAWKQQVWAGNRESQLRSQARRLEAQGLGERKPVDWDSLKPVAPDHACPVCHKLNRVYNPDDICVACRTIAGQEVAVTEFRGTGAYRGAVA